MEKDNLIAFLNAVLNPDDQKKLVSLELLDNNKSILLNYLNSGGLTKKI
jgi:hypothetical protein